MKKILFVFLLFTSALSYSNTITNRTFFLSKDSLPNNLIEKWKYFPGGSLDMSSVNYNDSQWQELKPELIFYEITSDFKGIGWFRYHFRVDSNLVNIPLAFSIKHFGASEIYLDGKLLKKYGEIRDSANSTYFNPQDLPSIFSLKDTGHHVFAIRYANFAAPRNYNFYRQDFAGYEMTIGLSEFLIEKKDTVTTIVTFILILLVGIFLILCLLHLFLFMYYPVLKSNLYFSIFMFCLTCLTMAGYLTLLSNDPALQLKSRYTITFLVCIGGLAISLFVNELFSKKKGFRFKIILAIAIAAMVMRILVIKIYTLVVIVLIVIISIEAVIIIILALYRKVKGARIIGVGILFFSLFFITLFALSVLSGGDYAINDETLSGRITLIVAAMSILSIPLSMSVYLAWNFATINKDLSTQLEQIKSLSQKNLEQEQEKVKMISGQNELLEQKVEERTAELKLEKKKSDDLLLNILPSEIAEELKQKGKSDAQLYDHVSVLFTDFVSFTTISEKLSPNELVDIINQYFTAFDEIMGRNGLEKIKTIGDAYMAVCGMPNNDADHAIKTVKAAREIIDFMKKHKLEGGEFDIRIGINSGAVVAGIVGVKKFAYDIWGDTVNTAARMEQNSEPGKINISGSTYELVKDQFDCIHRGKIHAKNKGDIDMYFV